MFIDFIYLTLLIVALIKGYSKGIVVALCSVLAVIAGLVAALKLSDRLAEVLFSHQAILAARWAPLVSHILVFTIVVILVRLLAKVIKKSLKMVLLGWADRLAGALLYGLILTVICSAFLWLGTKMTLLKTETLTASKTAPIIAPVAPAFIRMVGEVIPPMQSSYDSLNDFFEQLDHKLNRDVDTD